MIQPMLQLNPPIPVDVLPDAPSDPTKRRRWPHGPGHCIAFLDYSQEHFTLWKVAFDSNGEVWDVPQSHIRLQSNPSLGRVTKFNQCECPQPPVAAGVLAP